MAFPDFEGDCWIHIGTTAEIQVGDVFAGIPLLKLDADFRLFVADEGERPGSYYPVTYSLGVVVNTAVYSIVVPITTADDVAEGFDALVDKGHSEARSFCSLPELTGIWEGDAIAVLFQPLTLPQHFLRGGPADRLAAMTDEARKVLEERYVAASSPDS